VIRNIIFDWSGTLVDDLPAVWKATNYVLTQAQRDELSLDEFRSEFCLPFSSFYEKHTPDVARPQLESWFHSRFRQVQDSICELPHARDFLEFCRAHQRRLFLLSAVYRDHFVAHDRVTGFGVFFERPYIEVHDKRQKIHEILAENGLNADETLFIGDMQHDIETARHGGVLSCAVLTGYNTLAQLREARPDLIVEHLGELRRMLEQNGFELASARGGAGSGGGAESIPVSTVGALIFDNANRVLMIRTHKWSDLWGIPGGKIKWGETSIDALRREIKEETHLDIRDVEFVLVQDCIHSKEFYRDAHFILLNYTCRCAGVPEVRLNEEAREFKWMTVDEALKMPINEPTRTLLMKVRGR
jgi:phosphoglycolate phosphatase